MIIKIKKIIKLIKISCYIDIIIKISYPTDYNDNNDNNKNIIFYRL